MDKKKIRKKQCVKLPVHFNGNGAWRVKKASPLPFMVIVNYFLPRLSPVFPDDPDLLHPTAIETPDLGALRYFSLRK